MAGDTPHGGGAAAATAATSLLEVAPPASQQVGSVVRARRGLRSDHALVLAASEGQVEVVWPSGETAFLPQSKIKQTLAVPVEGLRSVAGRLMRSLAGDLRYRTEAQAVVIRARIDELTKVREHALALLLDRGALSLGLADCLALPIEPWRVRYDFLTTAPTGDQGAADLAREIVADRAAPLGVRTLVALKVAIPVGEVASEVAVVFASDEAITDRKTLETAAAKLAQELDAVGVRSASKLALAVDNPLQLSTSLGSAALLAALERPVPPGKRLAVGSADPLSVVDDLIDRGVAVEVDGTTISGDGPGGRGSLASYVTARTNPAGLPSDMVVALGFGAEAVRRYLAGDIAVESALPHALVADVKALRAAVDGQDFGEEASDPHVRELGEVLAAKGTIAPSEQLLVDRSVWVALIAAGVAGSATTGPLGEDFAGVSALSRASKALYEWRWTEARSIARDGLREARREDVRDELLNITACALWLQGEPEPALAALDNALEGAYTDALLINASVIATELEHDSAVDRLVKLAREAPSAHQRAVAAERALIFWINDDHRIWEDDEEETLPPEIRDALRPLIPENLPEDRYKRILRVLANRDDDWLAAQPDSAFGANARGPNRAAVRVFKARAAGIDKYVEVLASELKAVDAQDWVGQERDSVVEAAIEVLFDRNDELAAAFFGLTLIDASLPMSAVQRVPLKCLTVASIAANVDPDESEPNLRFIDLVAEAHRELSEVDASDRDRLSGLVEIAAERLARSYSISRYRQFDEVIDAYNMMMDRIWGIPSRNLNRQAVRQAFTPISEFCTDTYDIFKKLHPLIGDAQLEEAVVSMMKQASDIGHRIAEVTR